MKILSPAKVNLLLRITDRRQDGYHNIFSIFTFVDFGDIIEIKVKPDRREFSLKFPAKLKLKTEENLIFKAYNYMQNKIKSPFGIDVQVIKKIPMGAGLGGGSSNAAVVLYSIMQAFNISITQSLLNEIAYSLGADIPPFLKFLTSHSPYLLVEGIGERVTPLKTSAKYYFLLVNPGLNISTKWAYSNFKKKLTNSAKLHNSIRNYETLIEKGEAKNILHNDFEALLFETYKEYGKIKTVFQKHNLPSLISGSGATIFALAKNKNPLISAQKELDKMGLWTQICKTFCEV